MSGASSNHDVAELTLLFRGLRVTVVGPGDQAARVLAAISELPQFDPQSPPSEFELLEEVSRSTTRSQQERSDEIEASFGPCPSFVLATASRLGGSRAVAEQRIRRAFVAGQWARAVLDNRIASPARTEQLLLRPRVFVVLRADRLREPTVFETSRDYWNCIGSSQDSSSVSHAFPSETEARAYCSVEVTKYILAWQSAQEEDGFAEAFAFVVDKRPQGLLVALPVGFLPAEVLVQSALEEGSLIGPYTEVVVPGVVEEGGVWSPVGADLNVLLVDFDASVASQFRVAEPVEDVATPFSLDDPFAFPEVNALLAAAREWVISCVPEEQEASDGWYTAVPEEPLPAPRRAAPKRARKKAEVPDGGTTSGGNTPKQRRPTTASLSLSVDAVLKSLPEITATMRRLEERQSTMEQMVGASTASRTLSQPLSSQVLVSGPPMTTLAKAVGPPPRTSARASPTAEVPGTPLELLELEQDKPDLPSSPLAKAMLAQSVALNSLVAQLAGSSQDPMADLQSVGVSGNRGSAGRSRLQLELAQHRGHFFDAMLRSMSRRMHPTSPPDRPALQLLADGVCGTRYLERFGGYGRQKDLGLIQWNLMQIVDFMMADNYGAARDALALTVVMIEQAVLDSGRFEVAQVLTLQEDVPAGVGDNSHRLPQRARHDHFKADRAARRRQDSSSLYYHHDGCESHSEEERSWKRKRSGDTESGGGGAMNGQPPALNLLRQTTDFATWAICLTRWILQTRTDFAWHLVRSFSVQWRGVSSSTAVLPLPVPFPGCFGGGLKLSKRRLGVLARKRVVHILVIIVDYLYLGRFPSLSELERPPSLQQRRCLQRLRAFVAACGSQPGVFPCAPGRSGPELISCLHDLEQFIDVNQLDGAGYLGGAPVPSVRVPSQSQEHADEFPELAPYRQLAVDRLKINGQGKWPLKDYLQSDLWLPFVEPRSLLHGFDIEDVPVVNFDAEVRSEYLKLARKWDGLGLLQLHASPLVDDAFCKVFNVYKDADRDRQIGDRRLQNYAEYSAGGPSRHLPVGPQLLGLLVPRGSHRVRGSLTDRRDFYHQAAVTWERGRSNATPFSFSRFELGGLVALEEHDRRTSGLGKQREKRGDRLGGEADVDEGNADLFPCFAALYQGDHLGVEYALEGHQNLLVGEGLLDPSERVQGHHPLPLAKVWQGLIIDDFFVLSVEPRHVEKIQSPAYDLLQQARSAYDKHDLPGSPEKDVVAEELFKAAGAEVDSRDELTSAGLCLVGAPLSKRLGLSLVTLRAARLGYVTPSLASRLAGSWVSVLLYRRCISSVVKDFFKYAVDIEKKSHAQELPRKVATELAMLACLVPLLVTDVSCPVLDEVFATDASLSSGAIVSARVDKKIAEMLWLDGDRKGYYTMLQNGFRAALKAVGEASDDEEPLLPRQVPLPKKPPLMVFDFIEVCGGAGKVSKYLSQLGYVVGPVLDLSVSVHYDLKQLELLRWLMHLLENKQLKSVMCEPPCTTFSAAAHPSCRSYDEPLGWDRKNPKVLNGNVLAFRCLTLIWCCLRLQLPGLLEQPRLSKMAWLRAWRWLLRAGCSEAVVASCYFGSPHRKEFRLLLTGLDAKGLERRCPGGHRHVLIQGQYTRPSAVYVDGVAEHFALAFAAALKRSQFQAQDEVCFVEHESPLVNDILQSANWEEEKVWSWRSKAHINVLETSTVVSLLERKIAQQPCSRLNVLLDSAVAKGALAKGRSSSRCLLPVLRRSAACQLAGNLYPSQSFAPTRLNVADDPTRERQLRQPSQFSILDFLTLEEVRGLHWRRASKGVAGWIRLCILLSVLSQAESSWTFPSALHCSSQTSGLGSGILTSDGSPGFDPSWLSDSFLSFWAWVSGLWICLLCGFVSSACFCCLLLDPKNGPHHFGGRWLASLMVLSSFTSVAAPMAPESSAEAERALRRESIFLNTDRVLRETTRANRQKLLSHFESWLWSEHQVSWGEVISRKPVDPEEICGWLISYGKDLHGAGKSYSKYAETINAVAALRPIVKKQLTAAWDLAFAWLVDEPHQHHPALPASVLLAMMSLAICWGWGEPKTRGRGARHQSAKIEPEDLVRLISAVFRRHSPSQKLWPLSSQTLRRRFNQLLTGLGLPVTAVDGQRPYDLGSLRPGGATHMLNRTEDCTLVQRRGRWLSYKVMTIYLQEVAVATAVPRMRPEVRAKIQNLAEAFPGLLEEALRFLDWQIPTSAWYLFFGQRPYTTGDVSEQCCNAQRRRTLVSETAAVKNWNNQNPQHLIEVGQAVLEANGISEPRAAIFQAFRDSMTVELLLSWELGPEQQVLLRAAVDLQRRRATVQDLLQDVPSDVHSGHALLRGTPGAGGLLRRWAQRVEPGDVGATGLPTACHGVPRLRMRNATTAILTSCEWHLGTDRTVMKDWEDITPDAKECLPREGRTWSDTVGQMQTQNGYRNRGPTAAQMLEHKWLDKNAEAGQQCKNLKRFNEGSRMKKATARVLSREAVEPGLSPRQVALTLIAQQLKDEDLEQLRNTFLVLDKNKEKRDGTLSIEEIQKGIAESAVEMPSDLIEIMLRGKMKNLDTDGQKQYLKKEVLWSAFRVFDKDGDGRITKQELANILKEQADGEAIKAMVSEVDLDGDGEISFDEFAAWSGTVVPWAPSKLPRGKPSSENDGEGSDVKNRWDRRWVCFEMPSQQSFPVQFCESKGPQLTLKLSCCMSHRRQGTAARK
eukprot:Skav204069  [mRNA]  locus=scaffold3:515457:529911:- [translate_table: standard]